MKSKPQFNAPLAQQSSQHQWQPQVANPVVVDLSFLKRLALLVTDKKRFMPNTVLNFVRFEQSSKGPQYPHVARFAIKGCPDLWALVGADFKNPGSPILLKWAPELYNSLKIVGY